MIYLVHPILEKTFTRSDTIGDMENTVVTGQHYDQDNCQELGCANVEQPDNDDNSQCYDDCGQCVTSCSQQDSMSEPPLPPPHVHGHHHAPVPGQGGRVT